MKTITFSLLIFFISNLATAASIEDVNILEVKKNDSSTEVKMQVADGPKDLYFYVDITNDDPKAEEKNKQVQAKQKKGDKYKLHLNIPSFSIKPKGSFYRSTSVNFKGKERE
jgi:hypothetical protein